MDVRVGSQKYSHHGLRFFNLDLIEEEPVFCYTRVDQIFRRGKEIMYEVWLENRGSVALYCFGLSVSCSSL